MINLGEAGEQKEPGGAGPIPRGSVVKVRLEIRKPKKADQQNPAVSIFSSGIKGLDCELTVVSGRFEGSRLWENWFLPPNMQTIKLTKGQEGACNNGFAKCRAVIEASRMINPDDSAANRNINSWFDLHGLEFPAKIGIDKPKAGDQYINNNVLKVLTVKDEHFQEVMGGGEHITDEPFPEIPPAPTVTGQAAGNAQQTTWGAQTETAQAALAQQTQPQTEQMNVPGWAQ